MTHMEAKNKLKKEIVDAINNSCLSISAVRYVLFEIDGALDKAEEDEYQKNVIANASNKEGKNAEETVE